MIHTKIVLREDQRKALDKLAAVSGLSLAEVVRQCIDRCADEIIEATEALEKHGLLARRVKRKRTKRVG